MQVIDLFSGIGGFSLSARWMGWRTVQFCEIDKFCQKVLAYHFPGVPIHNDIKTLTAKQIINNGLYDKNEPTIFVGGVPCQPWSQAGKRLGKEDDRDLWEETISLIGEIQPDFAILENVRGFTNWNGGLVFDEVQSDLETQGYEVLPFLLPACAVNAPHRRDRIWFIAYNTTHTRLFGQKEPKEQTTGVEQCNKGVNSHTNHNGCERIDSEHEKQPNEGGQYAQHDIEQNDVSNPESERLEGRIGTSESKRLKQGHKSTSTNSNGIRQRGQSNGIGEPGQFNEKGQIGNWENFPTEPAICGLHDGLPTKLDGITFPKWRNESIKGYGNAIVPQVAYELFKVIDLTLNQ